MSSAGAAIGSPNWSDVATTNEAANCCSPRGTLKRVPSLRAATPLTLQPKRTRRVLPSPDDLRGRVIVRSRCARKGGFHFERDDMLNLVYLRNAKYPGGSRTGASCGTR